MELAANKRRHYGKSNLSSEDHWNDVLFSISTTNYRQQEESSLHTKALERNNDNRLKPDTLISPSTILRTPLPLG